jgi:hypothetical protein
LHLCANLDGYTFAGARRALQAKVGSLIQAKSMELTHQNRVDFRSHTRLNRVRAGVIGLMQVSEERKATMPIYEPQTKFLSAADLNGGEREFVIEDVTTELFPYSKVEKFLIKFLNEPKRFPLNVTNGRAMVAAYGNNSDYWLNKTRGSIYRADRIPRRNGERY